MSERAPGEPAVPATETGSKRTLVATIGRARYLLPIALVFLLWEVLPRAGVVPALILPPLHEVLATLLEMTLSFELFELMATSLKRGFVAYLLALATAIPLGVLIGWKRSVYDYTEILLEALRPLPSVALIPIFLLVFGPTEKTILAVVFYPTFFYQLIATVYGTQNIDPTLIDSMKVIGMSQRRLFREVFLPGSLPGIFTGIRQTTATMLILVIVAEMLLASDGLGYFIMATQRNFQVSETYAGILAIAVLGFVLNKGVVAVQRRVLHWSDRQTM